MLIRHAEADRDAATVAAIYRPFVTDSVASLEERPPDAKEIARRIGHISARYPWLVAEEDGAVIGFAYGSRHRDRAAYRWAAETTVYVDRRHHRRGVGRALYSELLLLLRRQGVQVVFASVTLPNDASVGLHEAFGFQAVGVFRAICFKHGRWHDVGFWQLDLKRPRDLPPPELVPPPRS